MRARHRVTRAVLSTMLVVGLSIPPAFARTASASAHAGPMDAFYDKLARAEQAEGAGELERAGQLYAEAYDALPPAERGSETGSDVVRAASRVRNDQFLQNPKDPAPLRSHHELLERHIADVKAQQPSRDVSEFEKKLASVETLEQGFREEAGPEGDAPPPAPADPPPAVAPIEPQPDTHTDTLRPNRRPLGLGLTISGGIVLVGGVVLIAVGGNLFSSTTKTYLSQSPSAPTDCTLDGNICELNAWKDGEYARANALMAVGGVLSAVGLGFVIGGTVVLVRNRNARRTSLVPTVTPRFTGLTLSGTF